MMGPIFTAAAPGVWRADDITRGPFEGMQGGAVAALMCALVEAEAAKSSMGFVAANVTHFLRPAPVGELAVSVSVLRAGRRVSVIDAEISADGKRVATQRATLIQPQPGPAYPVPRVQYADISSATEMERIRPAHGLPYMMDAMERLHGNDGIVWFRLRRPIIDAGEVVANLLPAADWAHGLGPPQGAEARPPSVIPNADLSVHVSRPPSGAWIGVRHGTAWSRDGVGVGYGELLDEHGFIGRVAMSVAVTLL